MKDNLPYFKYSPNAYSNGVFEKVNNCICSICKNISDYRYSGTFYTTIGSPESICPFCIKNGLASKVYKGVFHDAIEYNGDFLNYIFDKEKNEFVYFIGDEEITSINDLELEELLFRTPGYSSWQTPQWLNHCDKLCIFIDYIEKFELLADLKKYKNAIEALEENYNCNIENLSYDTGFYLFQCFQCKKYILHMDHT